MEKLEKVTLLSACNKIDYYCFAGNKKLREINLSSTISSIGYAAFKGASITSINIPTYVNYIGQDAFAQCNKLKAFIGSVGTKYTVYENVLYNRDKTESISYPSAKQDKEFIVPNSVTTVKSYAFERANNLRELSFSTNLTRLNSYSISNCKNLKILILNSKKLKYSWNNVSRCRKLAVVVGRKNSAASYIADDLGASFISL